MNRDDFVMLWVLILCGAVAGVIVYGFGIVFIEATTMLYGTHPEILIAAIFGAIVGLAVWLQGMR
jgi:hypothetical protein